MEFWSELWLRVEESRECVATDVSVDEGRMRGDDSLVVDIVGDSSFMMSSYVHLIDADPALGRLLWAGLL